MRIVLPVLAHLSPTCGIHAARTACLALIVLVVPSLMAVSRVAAQSAPAVYSYEETGSEGWARLPAGRTWGAPSGVKIDPDGESLWVLERCGDYNGPGCSVSDLPAILKFDRSGNLVQSFGASAFIFPHGLAVDSQGNVYVADGRGEGGRGHTVQKFSPDGELLLTLGQPGVAGEGPNTLNRPSDVAIAANGDIFVADSAAGRVLVFAADAAESLPADPEEEEGGG